MWLPLGTNQGLPWLPLARSLTHLITCMMYCLQAIGLSGCGPECAQEQHHMALDCGVVLHTRQGMAPPHRPTALGLVVDTPTDREQFMWQPGYGLWLVPKGQPRVCMCISICHCASSGWCQGGTHWPWRFVSEILKKLGRSVGTQFFFFKSNQD